MTNMHVLRFIKVASTRGIYPPPPLQTPGLARDGFPGGGGGETVAK